MSMDFNSRDLHYNAFHPRIYQTSLQRKLFQSSIQFKLHHELTFKVYSKSSHFQRIEERFQFVIVSFLSYCVQENPFAHTVNSCKKDVKALEWVIFHLYLFALYNRLLFWFTVQWHTGQAGTQQSTYLLYTTVAVALMSMSYQLKLRPRFPMGA